MPRLQPLLKALPLLILQPLIILLRVLIWLVTLSNGQVITIAVGQSSASVDYAVRADDAYIEADDVLSVTIANTTGGNYEQLATAGTVTTTVTDDTDLTTVTLKVVQQLQLLLKALPLPILQRLIILLRVLI